MGRCGGRHAGSRISTVSPTTRGFVAPTRDLGMTVAAGVVAAGLPLVALDAVETTIARAMVGAIPVAVLVVVMFRILVVVLA